MKIARPEERYHAYPFELSGGMCQRVVIALALACRPQLLIADEPTTGLDVTTQKAVMDLVTDLTRERGMATVLITHDLGLAATYCDRIVVMEQGRVVETAPATTIFRAPAHAYTRKLMQATPRPGVTLRDLLPEGAPAAPLEHAQGAGAPLLAVSGLVKAYPKPKSLLSRQEEAPFRAVDSLNFTVDRGESVGLVGESGCGKSTTSTMVMRLLDPTEGSIVFPARRSAACRRRASPVILCGRRSRWCFRIRPNPSTRAGPRAGHRRSAPALPHRAGRRRDPARCEELARLVGLPVDLLDRFPHQLSGGQKARVGIARAIAPSPDLVILDEPTAALDVSVQAVVLNLLADLKQALGMSYLFVSHDLQVVRMLCDRVIVMRSGRIVEEGTTEAVLEAPHAEYTRALLAAIPRPPV